MNIEGFSNNILEKSKEAVGKLVPTKSSDRYNKQFKKFCEWRSQNGVTEIVEEVMLAYFLDLSNKMSPSSLWPIYSMVKSLLLVNENVDISRFTKLIAFLKKLSVGHQPNQAKTLTREDICKFMKEAPTGEYLLMKVVAMIGIAGGCRREELHNMSMDDVEETDTQLVITIPRTKTNQKRVFAVMKEADGINFIDFFKKYVSLRPSTNVNHRMLFLGYRNQKCIAQRVGIHTIGAMPKKIAQFLGLPDPEKYTGHSFRRSSATLLANAGADLTVLKRHGGWKSSSVAEKYVEDSIEGKQKIARMIQGGENYVEVLQKKSTEIVETVHNKTISSETLPPVNVEGNSDCTINIHINL